MIYRKSTMIVIVMMTIKIGIGIILLKILTTMMMEYDINVGDDNSYINANVIGISNIYNCYH